MQTETPTRVWNTRRADKARRLARTATLANGRVVPTGDIVAFLEALIDYVFSAAATGSFAKGGPLLSFFALFHTGVGVLTLALQSLAATPGSTANVPAIPSRANTGRTASD